MKCLWSVICQNSIIDKNTNSQSLINILEEIKVIVPKIEIDNQKIPVFFDLSSLFYDEKNRTEKKINLIINIFDFNNKIIDENKLDFIWEKNKKRMRVNIKINGLPINKSGTYYFYVKYKKEGESKYKITEKIPLDINLELK